MKSALVAGLLLPLGLLCERARASEADPWFGQDKALHFGVSVLLSAGGYAASSPWLHAHGARAIAGSAFSLSLGAGKELWDMNGRGDPSWRDFAWDVLGTALGTALALGVDAWLSPAREARAEATTQRLVFHF